MASVKVGQTNQQDSKQKGQKQYAPRYRSGELKIHVT